MTEPHLLTSRGKIFPLLNPKVEDIDLLSASRALAQINRYNGHCFRPYSVAEHCVRLTYAAQEDGHSHRMLLLILLHDFHESITGDFPSPIKTVLRLDDNFALDSLAWKLDMLLYEKLGIDPPNKDEAEIIKEYDYRILLNERDALLPKSPVPWFCEHLEPLEGVTFEEFPWYVWSNCFWVSYCYLSDQLNLSRD